MIDPKLVHPSVKEMVESAGEYSLNKWGKITSRWPQQAKDWAIECRAKGERAREKWLVKRQGEIKEMINDAASHGHHSLLSVALLCTSDEHLDMIISSFSRKLKRSTRCNARPK